MYQAIVDGGMDAAPAWTDAWAGTDNASRRVVLVLLEADGLETARRWEGDRESGDMDRLIILSEAIAYAQGPGTAATEETRDNLLYRARFLADGRGYPAEVSDARNGEVLLERFRAWIAARTGEGAECRRLDEGR